MADGAATPAGEPAEVHESSAARDVESSAVEVDDDGVNDAQDVAAADTAADTADSAADAVTHPGEDPDPAGPSHVRLALIVGVVVVLGLGGLAGWLGFRAYHSHQVAQQRELFLQVGRQGALNVTTLSYDHIESDVQRVLDSSTGKFYGDFQKRAPALVDVIKQVKSNSSGTVTAAALESDSPTEAEVLVAVTVKSASVGQPDRDPRRWRMRILVEKVGDDAKMSNVEFVP